MPELHPWDGEDESMPFVGGPEPEDLDEDGFDDDDDFHYFGPPMPDPDDLELGPVVDLFCTSCQRHTEHVVCESNGKCAEYRCSQCFAWRVGVVEPVFYDPGLHHEMTEGGDDMPF